ncbi:parathymosin, partial [Numida meleagris]|uniref:parathymosin n=1 Tax=Numida meleagris TaxID=8996 RepID=UPI000B3DFB73
ERRRDAVRGRRLTAGGRAGRGPCRPHIVLGARSADGRPPPPSLLRPLPSLRQVPPSLVTRRGINPLRRRIPHRGRPRHFGPGAGAALPDLWDSELPPRATPSPSALSSPGVPDVPERPRAAPDRMSEKRVEEAPAELSAKEMKEKKEKVEEKAVHKEKKKEIVEDEENGAEEDEEENPEDVDEEEGGDEDDEGDENGQEQDGHAEKRSAEEEEDEVDPKRQKTENGSSA